MDATVRRGAVVILLVLTAACADAVPTSPTGTPPSPSGTPPSPSETPPTNFPPSSGPARTFVFERELSYPVRDYTKNSRFILFDNGAFELHYPTIGSRPYRGSYTDENGLLNFRWEGCCGWGATGRLEGISLKVQYSLNMQMSDFEEAVYVRMPM